MKIVNLKDFLKLPAGRLFATYAPHSYEFGPLTIKDDTWKEGHNNFFFQELLEVHNDGRVMIETLDAAVSEGKSFSFDLSEPSRTGECDEGTLFAVYEPADAKQLITRLLTAFGESGLLDRGLAGMIDQVINVPSRLHHEPLIFTPGSPEPRFECTNLHTGDVHHLTADQVGEVLETGVAPIPPTRKVLVGKDKK
jgi:hypothetical protein